MKQKLILGLSLLAIAGMWTGCTNDEAVETASGQRAISFRTQGGTPEVTKATATTAATIDAFVVYGSDTDAASTPVTTKLFDAMSIARDANATTFSYAPARYYSTNAVKANFIAYSPVTTAMKVETINGVAGLWASTVTPVKFSYTMPKATTDGTRSQEDLLIADTVVVKGPGTDIPLMSNAVTLKFYHAFARVYVKAKNATNTDVYIKSLTLKNLLPNGTLTATPPASGATGEAAYNWTWAWEASGTKVDYSYDLATGAIVPANTGNGTAPNNTPVLVIPMEQGMMVLPQKVANTAGETGGTAKDFALEVEYSMGNLTNQTANIFLTAAGSGDANKYNFEMGKQYAIVVDFTGTEIKFEVVVEAFKDIVDIP